MENIFLRIIGKDKVARDIGAQSITVHENSIEAALNEDIAPLTVNHCLFIKQESGWQIHLVNRLSSVGYQGNADSAPYRFILFRRGAGDKFLTDDELARIQ